MRRSVHAGLELDVAGPALLALAVAVADGAHHRTETLSITQGGRPLDVVELTGPHGSRLHQVQAAAGRVSVVYDATVDGVDDPPPVDPLDLLTYLRPSRYAESDRIIGLADAELGGLSGRSLLDAVTAWVGSHVRYVPGTSGPTDGASQTVLGGQGVCRDFAHVTVGLLRALDVPARTAAVYAPGLSPMDFHAVAEAYVEGAWHVVDPTLLAPRSTMLRISTGRDAADTAFLSTYHAWVTLLTYEVRAVVDGDLPVDDRSTLVQLR
ncbi:transglutaminase-like domain-containing protein [Cellulomonas aerilata]|uniref:Putative transglutaminase-like protein n=1 Tax=Cellulomonas aerilata TaxID=515326 RepID=A0A512DEZ0_9CELL|nr:transglutaminase family protein [Cellulomonas aerilata]GEO35016.1 putative transglutaminase-like protein [Cellulomonas aerilata]